jgi:Fe2+ transport system protein B
LELGSRWLIHKVSIYFIFFVFLFICFAMPGELSAPGHTILRGLNTNAQPAKWNLPNCLEPAIITINLH